MSKSNDTGFVIVSVSLGFLLLAGAGVGGYMLLKKAAPAPVIPTGQMPQSSTGLVVGNGVVAPVGSSGMGWNAQAAADAERTREEAWRKTDKINQLQKELSDKRGELKRTMDELNVIDKTPMPNDVIMRWSQQHQTDCRNSRPMISKWSCNATDLTDGYDLKAKADWDAQKDVLKRGPATRKSELDSRIISLIDNLADLGVIVPRTL